MDWRYWLYPWEPGREPAFVTNILSAIQGDQPPETANLPHITYASGNPAAGGNPLNAPGFLGGYSSATPGIGPQISPLSAARQMAMAMQSAVPTPDSGAFAPGYTPEPSPDEGWSFQMPDDTTPLGEIAAVPLGPEAGPSPADFVDPGSLAQEMANRRAAATWSRAMEEWRRRQLQMYRAQGALTPRTAPVLDMMARQAAYGIYGNKAPQGDAALNDPARLAQVYGNIEQRHQSPEYRAEKAGRLQAAGMDRGGAKFAPEVAQTPVASEAAATRQPQLGLPAFGQAPTMPAAQAMASAMRRASSQLPQQPGVPGIFSGALNIPKAYQLQFPAPEMEPVPSLFGQPFQPPASRRPGQWGTRSQDRRRPQLPLSGYFGG